MSTILPTSAKLRQLVADYVTDSRNIAQQSLAVAESSLAFQEIYQISLTTYTILGNLSSRTLRPPLTPARNVAVRVPILVSVGQASVAQVELRRFVELIAWAVYFTDHPVEWKVFTNQPRTGFAQDMRKPISYAAHRELGFYLEYARELMEPEPSGLGIKAVDNVKQAVRLLNAAVHAGEMAKASGKIPPHDDMSEQSLRGFAKIHRLTFSSCSLLLAAFHRNKFDQLNAVSRASFDWLIGATLRREVRKGPFGLP
ncbi:MAG TPA: hypothetical protein VF553_19480 [Pyrinomonadaceae bacterium]